MSKDIVLKRLQLLQRQLILLIQAIALSTDTESLQYIEDRANLRQVQLDLKLTLDQLEKYV